MEVYYKFKSAKDFVSIPIDWHYTTASDVKEYVLKNKCSGKRNKANLDKLTLTNADTNEDYLDGETLIPKNSFLVIRRAPRFPCLPIVVNPPVQPEESKSEEEDDVGANTNSFDGPSVSLYPTDSEWVEFWNDLSPSTVLVPVQAGLPSKAEEERKIKDLIDNPALDGRQCHSSAVSFGAGRGFGHGGMGGRIGGRGFGPGELSDRITPPPGYICHRCKVPGHFIQHCPTNGDPSFDSKRTKPPTGDSCSILMDSPDGSNALPGGRVAVFKPNEATFEKSIQGMPSTRSVAKIPAALYCPLCRAVMKDAVLASKCCFKSFCDKCIRDYIMSKSLCICGAINVLADDLLPNKTLRDTIVRYLKSTNSNEANDGSSSQPQDMESAPGPQPNIRCSPAPSKGVLLSPKSEGNTKAEEITEQLEPIEADDIAHETFGKLIVGKGEEVSKAVHSCSSKAVHSCSSAPSKGVVLSTKSEGNTEAEEITEPVEADNVAHETLAEVTVGEGVEVSKSAHECAREQWPQMCPLTDEGMQQKPISGEVQKKRKKFADMHPRPHQDFADMPLESSSYNPYWNCMQPGFNGFGEPYCGQMPFMGYVFEPYSFGAASNYNPFGAQANMMSIPPQRDLGKFGTGSNGGGGIPIMSTGEFDAPKATIKQKQDHEKSRGSTKVSRDRDFYRCMITNEDVTPVKSDFKPLPERSTYDTELIRTSSSRKIKHNDGYNEEHSPRPLKKVSSKSSTEETSDWKHKASVLARISFPKMESPVYKKRKLGNSSPSAVSESSHHRCHSTSSNGYHEDQRKTAAAVSKNNYNYADDHIYELSDDDRHFKRSSRYESSPPRAVIKGRHSSRGWRERGVTAANISRLSVY